VVDSGQWLPVEDLDKPRHPIQLSLDLAELMLWHIGLLLQTYNGIRQARAT